MTSPAYRRTLGLFSGTMAVVGGIIGSGIFVSPAIVAQRVHTAPLTLGVWILGGIVALAGAFCFGELGQRRPRSGGSYVYIREALGGLPAFLYAWALLLAISTGAIAAVAVTFANYSVSLIGLDPGWARPLSVGAIVFLTGINILGIRPGSVTTNIFTVLKLGALVLLIVVGLGALVAGATPVAPAPLPPTAPFFAVAAGLVPVLFAYGGWQQTNFIAEELIDAERNLPRALVAGVAIVVTVYLLVNLAYLAVLGPAGLAVSEAPAAEALRLRLGESGARLIAAGIAASTFGFLNLVLMVTPRVYQTMAADGLFFPSFARLSPRFRTPVVALLFQAVWAIVLLFTGRYGQLLDYVVFCDWIFFGLAVVSLMIIRRRDIASGRDGGNEGFRAPFWPLTPLLFIGAAVYVVAGSVASNPGNALLGSCLLLLGVPVYLYWSARRGPVEGEESQVGSSRS